MGAQKDDPKAPNFDPMADSDESPVQEVTLDPFFLSKYEMTQGRWLSFTGENPSFYAPGDTYGDKTVTLRNPVEQVSWNDGDGVLRRLRLELPTEAQWEYAARAGTDTPWWTGREKASLADAANLADRFCKENGGFQGWVYEEWDDGYTVHAPVGSLRPNAFGLHDVLGNVVEWCRDGYGGYGLGVREGDGERRVSSARRRAIRGGGWHDPAPIARSTFRFAFAPESRLVALGLRPARALD